MGAVYNFLGTYEGLIYILLTLAGLFALRWLWNSWHEWRDAIYGLEREIASRRLSRALMITLLILFLFIGELFLASFVAPAIPAEEMLASPTLDLLPQSEGAPSGDITSIETAVATSPVASPDRSSGCIPEKLFLASPEPGQEVSGTVTLVGTADIENFGFYKYEFSPLDAGIWTTISAGREAVRNGDLGLWDTTTLTPGDYQLSLEATDNQGQLLPPCVISVRVSAP